MQSTLLSLIELSSDDSSRCLVCCGGGKFCSELGLHGHPGQSRDFLLLCCALLRVGSIQLPGFISMISRFGSGLGSFVQAFQLSFSCDTLIVLN